MLRTQLIELKSALVLLRLVKRRRLSAALLGMQLKRSCAWDSSPRRSNRRAFIILALHWEEMSHTYLIQHYQSIVLAFGHYRVLYILYQTYSAHREAERRNTVYIAMLVSHTGRMLRPDQIYATYRV